MVVCRWKGSMDSLKIVCRGTGDYVLRTCTVIEVLRGVCVQRKSKNNYTEWALSHFQRYWSETECLLLPDTGNFCFMVSKDLELRSGHREVIFRASCGQSCDLTPSLVSLKLLASYPLGNSQGRCRFVVLNIHRRLCRVGESAPLCSPCLTRRVYHCHINRMPSQLLASLSRAKAGFHI